MTHTTYAPLGTIEEREPFTCENCHKLVAAVTPWVNWDRSTTPLCPLCRSDLLDIFSSPFLEREALN